jgi:sugar fermentation stimulation protein A
VAPVCVCAQADGQAAIASSARGRICLYGMRSLRTSEVSEPGDWKNPVGSSVMNIRKAFSSSEWRKNGGIYHLVLSLQESRGLRVGSLGLQSFPIGYYVYTGSARRGLASRLRRHLRRKKTIHWHIDRLTRVARIEEIWVDFRPERTECESHGLILSMAGAKRPVPGFGSSDCRCLSHLAHFDRMPVLHRKGKRRWRQTLVRILGSAGR